jgi:glyoxylase-like metal-dependent hydrolase (beta-lactamase superfamily II)
MSAAERPSRKLGDFELTIVSDGTYYLDAGGLFGVVPKPLWQKKISADAMNRIAVGTNCVIVRANGKIIVIETGIGNKLPEKLAKIYDAKAQLARELEAIGIDRKKVDVVINSHLHFDHCGWNTFRNDRGEVEPTFPNAIYYAQRGEWEHGSRQLERDKVSYISDNYDPLIKSGQMRLLDGGSQIMPGISVALYPGHTRYMQAIMLESGGEKACYISDLIPTTWHLDLTWVMAYDLYPLETIENRKCLYAHAIPEKWLVIFTHDHETPWAFLERDSSGKVSALPA